MISEMLKYEFMKNAFLAVLVITPLFGLLGTVVVSKKMAFFSDALGHSALTGMGIGVLLGIADTDLSMALFGVAFALLLNFIKRKNVISNDTVISVFASHSTALGLVILSKGGNFSKYSGLLVGDILSISRKQVIIIAIVLAVTLIFWAVCFNSLHEISISESLAKSRGLNVKLYDNLFAILLALIVMLTIKWVGILIINALLIVPAAAARNLSSNEKEYHIFSVAIALFCGIMGLLLSYFINVAAGPMIVVFAAIIFFITLFVRPLLK